MAWVTEEGAHEGVVARLLPGGQISSGSTTRIEPDGTRTPCELWWEDGTPRTERLVPAREVEGWQVRCECGWTGPRYTRVEDPDQADRDAGRLYAHPDGGDLDEDFEEGELRYEWEQHLVPVQALDDITVEARAVAEHQRRLDDAVAAARSQSLSWDRIGRAAGITRQTAHERWARTPSVQ